MFYYKNCLSDHIITSESVSNGHPDKVADQISDAILDYYISLNPLVHTAIETLVTKNKVIISGEICGVSINKFDIECIARQVIKEIGYEQDGFHWKYVVIEILIHEQSPDIVVGVSSGEKQGAGDQGIVYGYAINETETFMPASIFYSHLILKNIISAVKNCEIPNLGPDAKTQITLLYKNNVPVRASNIVLSIQHSEDLSKSQIRDIVYPYVKESLPEGWMCPDSDFLVNPAGRFVVGGPVGDCGLTGRKIMIDTYGGHVPHGGGAFSGKDPSKIDRSAAYMARYLARNVVSAKLADQCLVQLSYAIGVSYPISFYVNTFGTGFVDDDIIKNFIQDNIDLSPYGICKHLVLLNPIYRITSCYGHFGRIPDENGSFSWEREDLALKLKNEFHI
ncbi:methionine adenosyltransferase [Ehrlichia chaffeensis str. Heartland]|uniref:Methionine adenosyltransferase n=1 Tax=Ehrlichia chaffeensis (strain ATCC CRL-10679 / Arkansas) TaxID=205920 RepID=Q2GI80_EHRCR|nr:methionine adenosyltransferase [Ehrlichia chaffeensis]ABD45373.1 S-adenosylmethionine synthetase [Ehrlichia chaffeensis str. Arkansas]AHX03191.1 methionine adenosyltransferase [Ehrlichia chaffeensis str. Heartland]AHX05107.1 methionine adenosyltransferase [Ehrlichia chaffeensis str. Jax]AHX06096.1 methionine adenosyltransferase [Ehrlichia chaffeensis str. Liberty]AHX07437.1 methionine adenosyltransferase [Ehrlichia chaffeensis str. Osceola]